MKFNEKQKKTFYKILIIGEIQLICLIIYLTISTKFGDIIWTYEMLRSSITGNFIQIFNLVLLINGIILSLYIVIFLILLLKS